MSFKPPKNALMPHPTGYTDVPLRKKELFFNVRKKVHMVTKPREGGLKALVSGPLRKDFFCGFRTGCTFRVKMLVKISRGDKCYKVKNETIKNYEMYIDINF